MSEEKRFSPCQCSSHDHVTLADCSTVCTNCGSVLSQNELTSGSGKFEEKMHVVGEGNQFVPQAKSTSKTNNPLFKSCRKQLTALISQQSGVIDKGKVYGLFEDLFFAPGFIDMQRAKKQALAAVCVYVGIESTSLKPAKKEFCKFANVKLQTFVEIEKKMNKQTDFAYSKKHVTIEDNIKRLGALSDARNCEVKFALVCFEKLCTQDPTLMNKGQQSFSILLLYLARVCYCDWEGMQPPTLRHYLDIAFKNNPKCDNIDVSENCLYKLYRHVKTVLSRAVDRHSSAFSLSRSDLGFKMRDSVDSMVMADSPSAAAAGTTQTDDMDVTWVNEMLGKLTHKWKVELEKKPYLLNPTDDGDPDDISDAEIQSFIKPEQKPLTHVITSHK